MNYMNKWDKKFIELSKHLSSWSKDKSTKVAAIIVDKHNRIVSNGYNGFPQGINDNIDERHIRPQKYLWTEHAERNAIYNAARVGVSTMNCKIYIQLFPCVDCSRAIIQSGIDTIYTYEPDFSHHKYGEEWKVSLEMLKEANIKINLIEKNES